MRLVHIGLDMGHPQRYALPLCIRPSRIEMIMMSSSVLLRLGFGELCSVENDGGCGDALRRNVLVEPPQFFVHELYRSFSMRQALWSLL